MQNLNNLLMLEICKASAGSGKTYKLTGEYIGKLLEPGNEDKFRHILAVTFTNKATDEMKQRVLDRLYGMSVSQDSSEAERDKAREILVEILNDYNSFNICTIDRFLLRTLRAFAREIGQYSSYNVELDSDSVLTEAVDLLMSSLGENEPLLDWLIHLSIVAIESGESWNPVPKLHALGKELFSEKYKIQSRDVKEKLKDKEFLESYRKDMLEIIRLFEDESVLLGKTALEKMSEYGLSPTFFIGGGKSPFLYFEKWASGEIIKPTPSFIKLADAGVDGWYAKKTDKAAISSIQSAYFGGLSNILEKTVSLYEHDYRDYATATVILKNLLTLGVLNDIYASISEYCKKKNIVLLSETTNFLNRIIDGSDTPFIYEKIGGRIDNYMLDEFQDTSLMQWANFKPLVKDSLGNGMYNLIVGDVKQSIYRWRSSDWNLLNSKVYKDFDKRLIADSSLDTNRRSLENVVVFNNSFFKKAGEILQAKYNEGLDEPCSLISGIYTSFEQKVLPDKMGTGHVKISFIEKDLNENGWKSEAMSRIPDTLQTLKSNGYSLNDIAILVRTNSEGALIADFLLNNGYKVISEDSLYISSSTSVQKIVTTLKYLTNPNDAVSRFLFKGGHIETTEKSLFSICEEMVRALSVEERRQGAFIQAFMDCVIDYVSINGSNVGGFIKWWDETGRKRCISAPEGEDAIRIMTIHKSKGLGFKAVIVPFMDDNLFKADGRILWCKPDQRPFNRLELIPVGLETGLTDTLFSRYFLNEKLYSYVDALNICYVAFTRAIDELIIYAQKPKINKDGGYGITSMSSVLYNCYENELDENLCHEIGTWTETDEKKDCIADDDMEDEGIYESIPTGERLKLSYSAPDFFSEENLRTKGVIMHDILSHISVPDDIEKTLKEAVSDGRILASDYQPLYRSLISSIESVEDRHWFDGTYKHHNETTIIAHRGDLYRPDRVMVRDGEVVVLDYKFGHYHSPSYREQVEKYKSLMEGMGYLSVSGYLWYLEENIIEEV